MTIRLLEAEYAALLARREIPANSRETALPARGTSKKSNRTRAGALRPAASEATGAENPRPVLTVTIPGEPVPKERPRFANGKVFTPAETIEGERAVGWELKRALRDTEPDAVSSFAVEVEFYCASAKSDCDNLLKLVLDSANNLVWRDDRQVLKLAVRLYRDAEDPRTVLRIWTI